MSRSHFFILCGVIVVADIVGGASYVTKDDDVLIDDTQAKAFLDHHRTRYRRRTNNRFETLGDSDGVAEECGEVLGCYYKEVAAHFGKDRQKVFNYMKEYNCKKLVCSKFHVCEAINKDISNNKKLKVKCVVIKCQQPVVPNGNAKADSLIVGSTIKFDCNEGYVLQGNATSECVSNGTGNADGKWSNPSPVCTEITCQRPVFPNGYTSSDSLKVGNTINYHCNEGYVLHGKASSICVSNGAGNVVGKWADPSPVCTAIVASTNSAWISTMHPTTEALQTHIMYSPSHSDSVKTSSPVFAQTTSKQGTTFVTQKPLFTSGHSELAEATSQVDLNTKLTQMTATLSQYPSIRPSQSLQRKSSVMEKLEPTSAITTPPEIAMSASDYSRESQPHLTLMTRASLSQYPSIRPSQRLHRKSSIMEELEPTSAITTPPEIKSVGTVSATNDAMSASDYSREYQPHLALTTGSPSQYPSIRPSQSLQRKSIREELEPTSTITTSLGIKSVGTVSATNDAVSASDYSRDYRPHLTSSTASLSQYPSIRPSQSLQRKSSIIEELEPTSAITTPPEIKSETVSAINDVMSASDYSRVYQPHQQKSSDLELKPTFAITSAEIKSVRTEYQPHLTPSMTGTLSQNTPPSSKLRSTTANVLIPHTSNVLIISKRGESLTASTPVLVQKTRHISNPSEGHQPGTEKYTSVISPAMSRSVFPEIRPSKPYSQESRTTVGPNPSSSLVIMPTGGVSTTPKSSIDGNQGRRKAGPESATGRNIGIGVGIALLVIIILTVIGVYFFIKKRREQYIPHELLKDTTATTRVKDFQNPLFDIQ